MTTATETRQQVPARYTFRDLAHADVLIAEHARTMPGYSAPLDVHETWNRMRDELVAYRDSLLPMIQPLLCWKCQGTGTTQWKHRSGGTCYSCHGDGWSAKGRRTR